MLGVDADMAIVLADSNTQALLQRLELQDIDHIIIVPAGDEHKSLCSLQSVWDNLIKFGASRRSLLVNVGGGMITDLGGMAAATYMRGMPFVNIPTTLLAMVDASVGGKTGINYGGAKNVIGVFAEPARVVLHPELLDTLPVRQRLSGYAEMVKHGLLAGNGLLDDTLCFDIDRCDTAELGPLIERNIQFKQSVVQTDPHESGPRKALNLGHTVGHAIEALLIERGRSAEHGFCVAWGLIAAAYLSVIMTGFPREQLTRLTAFVRETYGPPPVSCDDYDRLYSLMQRDKKNSDHNINFTLLSDVGHPLVDCRVERDEIFEAIDYQR